MKNGLQHFPKWSINVIANTFEKYINISIQFKVSEKIRNLTILDSLQFLNSTLDKLADQCPNKFHTSAIPVSDDVKHGKGNYTLFNVLLVILIIRGVSLRIYE